MPTLQRLGFQVPNTYTAGLWNPRVPNVIVKWNITIDYNEESDYMERDPPEQLENSGKITQTQPPKTSTVK